MDHERLDGKREKSRMMDKKGNGKNRRDGKRVRIEYMKIWIDEKLWI